MERNNRKVYTGTVISTKMDKTITVFFMSFPSLILSATKRFRLVEIVKKAEII